MLPEEYPESEFEEFVLAIDHNARVWIECRADSDGIHKNWGAPNRAWVSTIVKAYAPEDWQMMTFNPAWLDCVIIGYCERRLSEDEELAIRNFVARYWDLPF